MRTGKTISCNVCSKQIYIPPGRLRKTKTICCSRKCSNTLIGPRLRKRIEVPCYICSKSIYMKVSQNKRVLHPACSMECKIKIKSMVNKGKSNPNSNNFTELEAFFNNRAG